MCKIRLLGAALLLTGLLSGCGGGGGGGGDDDGDGTIPVTSSSYIVVAWNDLGMHCLNPSYDTAVILPPYNTVWAQVIKRGNPPQVVTSGLTVTYRIINNTTSQGKGLFYQFWTYAQQLFNLASPLAIDKGLNLDNLQDSSIRNGLSGTMVSKGDHFQVNGIPVVPYADGSSTRNPYQVAEITVKDAGGTVVAQTRATVPTSEEINCGKCHLGSTVTQVFNDVLLQHDLWHGTSLQSNKPVLCASCHGSPVLGTTGPGSSGKYLSQAIHASHASRGAACYDCHPGATTRCNRSIRHTNNNAADGNCTTCHGDMATVASSIVSGRVPWDTEPTCVSCHTGVAQVNTGTTLYRNAAGHGGVYCAGCHGSPHAMVPSSQSADNYQANQYQNAAVSIGSCAACHSSSRGGGTDFVGEHVNEGRTSACNVCHTGFQNASNTANWPHQFQWKAR